MAKLVNLKPNRLEYNKENDLLVKIHAMKPR